MSKSHYILRDCRNNLGTNAMFWAEKGGYTSNLNNAERFTKERALRQHRSRDTDQPMPLKLLQKMAHTTVDHQDLPAEFDPTSYPCFVVQIDGMWDGNDIFFYRSGKPGQGGYSSTTNLDMASMYTYEAALKIAGDLSEAADSLLPGQVKDMLREAKVWPVDLLNKIGRPVVQAKDIEAAIAQAQLSTLDLMAAASTEQE